MFDCAIKPLFKSSRFELGALFADDSDIGVREAVLYLQRQLHLGAFGALQFHPSGLSATNSHTQPQHALLGLFDWSYNRDPADDLTGTFALGSTLDLAEVLIHKSLSPGQFMLSLSVSAS